MVSTADRPSLSSRRRPGPAMLGPAFVAAIAYVDPGNVATNIAAGDGYGYLLLWVVVMANAMAALVQYLAAKLGLVTGGSLPEAMRDRLPRPLRLAYWAQAEVVAMATDLAEVLGGAIALHILLGLPLVPGGLLTAAASLALLTVRDRRGQRSFEWVVVALLAVVAVGFCAGLWIAGPDPSGIASGMVPRLAGSESLLLAAAILGATMMPHAGLFALGVGPRSLRRAAAGRAARAPAGRAMGCRAGDAARRRGEPGHALSGRRPADLRAG